MRASMLDNLNQDYVRTARAKGLSPFRVTGVHALRNALIPLVTVAALEENFRIDLFRALIPIVPIAMQRWYPELRRLVAEAPEG